MSFIRVFIAFIAACAVSFAYAEQAISTAAKENTAQVETAKSAVETVNINTANVQELQTLKGIGSAKAQAIVDYRTQHGSFKAVDELTQVKGISEKVLANLQKNNPGRIIIK